MKLPTFTRVRSVALICLIASLLVGALGAQDAKKPPSLDEITSLHEAGVSSEDILTIFDRTGVPTLTAPEIEKLEKAGVPVAVTRRLKDALPKTTLRVLTLDDIKILMTSGVPESQVLALIDQSTIATAPTVDQILDLVRSGVSSNVVKAIRGRVQASSSTPVPELPQKPKAASLKLEELPRLTQEGTTADSLIKRIRESDSRFEVNVDQLVVLTRQGVATDVLKEVWSRRIASEPASTNDTGTHPVGATSRPTVTDSKPVAAYALHRETAGGFSLLAPGAFVMRREARGANALVSFTRGEPDSSGLADAEISIFRYRSTSPDRLVESNLTPIANDFLNRLRASYAARKLSAVFGDPRPMRLAGRPAILCRASTSAADGTVHSGEIAVTWSGDQIFVLSTAARTDQAESITQWLSTSLRSFSVDSQVEAPAPAKNDSETIAALADTWRTAVTTRDAGLYDVLCGKPADSASRREAFTSLCDRICQADRRLVVDPGSSAENSWTIPCRLLGGAQTEAFTLIFTKTDGKFILTSN